VKVGKKKAKRKKKLTQEKNRVKKGKKKRERRKKTGRNRNEHVDPEKTPCDKDEIEATEKEITAEEQGGAARIDSL